MRLNICKNPVFIALLIVLVFTQFGCRSSVRYKRRQFSRNTDVLQQTQKQLSRTFYNRRQQRKQLREKPVNWNTLVSAINAGLIIKTEAIPYGSYNQNNEVSIRIYIPVKQSDSTTQNLRSTYKLKYAYVNCPNINNDLAIIQRNKLNDGLTLLNPQDEIKLVNFIRKAAISQCQKS